MRGSSARADVGDLGVWRQSHALSHGIGAFFGNPGSARNRGITASVGHATVHWVAHPDRPRSSVRRRLQHAAPAGVCDAGESGECNEDQKRRRMVGRVSTPVIVFAFTVTAPIFTPVEKTGMVGADRSRWDSQWHVSCDLSFCPERVPISDQWIFNRFPGCLQGRTRNEMVCFPNARRQPSMAPCFTPAPSHGWEKAIWVRTRDTCKRRSCS
jgi:hypothetical protein